MPVGLQQLRAGIVNNKFNFIFHVKNPHQDSLIDLCFALAGPIVSIYSYMYFFIITSVVNIPLSALLTFLLTNISQLDRLWSDMLCQHEGVVSNDFMNNFALITSRTQKFVLLLKPCAISSYFLHIFYH